jgi:hypothetical protein
MIELPWRLGLICVSSIIKHQKSIASWEVRFHSTKHHFFRVASFFKFFIVFEQFFKKKLNFGSFQKMDWRHLVDFFQP